MFLWPALLISFPYPMPGVHVFAFNHQAWRVVYILSRDICGTFQLRWLCPFLLPGIISDIRHWVVGISGLDFSPEIQLRNCVQWTVLFSCITIESYQMP